MVQLAGPPRRTRFTEPSSRRAAHKLAPQQQIQSKYLAPQKHYSRTRLLRYRLLVLKVRIKVFFIKAKRRPRLTSGVIALLTVLCSSVFLLMPRPVSSVTDREFFYQQLGQIKQKVDFIEESNHEIHETMPDAKKIDEYRNALLDGIATCEAMNTRVESMGPEAKKKYENALSQVNRFCTDFEEVNDYANRVSKATKQFVTYPSHGLLARDSTQSINNIIEITGYASTDLEKLKSNPVEDPALSEMFEYLNKVQKKAQEAQTTPSPDNIGAFYRETTAQQENLLNARIYYWTNTINIDLLQKAVERLQNEFKD